MFNYNNNNKDDDPEIPLHPPLEKPSPKPSGDPSKQKFISISAADMPLPPTLPPSPQPVPISRCPRIMSRMGICTSPHQDLENQLDDNETNLDIINSKIDNIDCSILRFEEIIERMNSTINNVLNNELVPRSKMEYISQQIKVKIANQQSVAILKSNKEELVKEKLLLTSFNEINTKIKELTSNVDYKKIYNLIQINYTDIIDFYKKYYKNATYDTKIREEYDLLIKTNVDALKKLIMDYIENTLPLKEEKERSLSPRLEVLRNESVKMVTNLRNSPIPKENKMCFEIENLYNELVDLNKHYDLLSQIPDNIDRENALTKKYWQEILPKITEYEDVIEDMNNMSKANKEGGPITFGGKKKKGRKTKRRQKAVNRKTKKVKIVKKRKSKRKTRKSSRK